MQSLQSKADVLKKEQVQLKTAINEKNTANILCALFSKDKTDSQAEDPRIEALLRRTTDDIPDSSKLSALQPLILPSGATHSKKNSKMAAAAVVMNKDDLPDDGIDYELLGKDRTKCTPAELDRIRRERNRMHAKRTRDRKRHFMEEMTDMCKTLENENGLLRHHLMGLNGGILPELQPPTPLHHEQQPLPSQQSVTISPSLPPASPTNAPTGFREITRVKRSLDKVAPPAAEKPASTNYAKSTDFGQLDTLLEAAGTSVRTYHPYSSGSSSEDEGSERPIAFKRARKLSALSDEAIPRSIASTAASSMTSIGV
jgi:Basic region leucine zipper